MKKKSSYALIALALLAGVAIGHVTSQAVAGSACKVDLPESRADLALASADTLYVTVFSPYKIVQTSEISPHRISVKFSK